MSKLTEIIAKIRRKWMKLRLQPIRVYCMHHVSDTFDESTMCRVDWIQIDEFKDKVLTLKKNGVQFISLSEAYKHICNDRIRCKNYAVLTFDDGWASLKNILPWLNEQQIPVSLFINPAYLDGKHYRNKETEKYLTWEDLNHAFDLYPLVTIGSHGWNHADTTQQTIEVFENNVVRSIEMLKRLPNYISFYAFPYGKYSEEQIQKILDIGLVPLLVSGDTNYVRKQTYIDREILGLH